MKLNAKTRLSGRFLGFLCLICLILACVFSGAVLAQESDIPGTAGPEDNISDVKFGSIVPIVRETGKVSLSVDGLGTNSASGIIQVQKPAGATVKSAFLAAASTGFSGRVLINGDVRIDGVGVTWSIQTPSSISSSNHWADVTSMVKSKIDAAPAGRVSFTISEVNPGGIDGEILAVIFDDPNQTTDNTVALLFGAQAVGGDTFALGLADPLDKSDPNLALNMALGISFGFQLANNGTQHSTVDVNNVRLTSSAGGQDDGESANGALLTVGGLDDSTANPVNPVANSGPDGFRTDDELYDLEPLVSDGTTAISVFTRNPSNDDNIFFASFFLKSTTAVVGEGINLSPASAKNPVGTPHTVTATMQDVLGRPVVGRTVTFTIKKGPQAGLTNTDITDAEGKARFTYTGNAPGVDNIEARALDSRGEEIVSNVVVSEFFIANGPPTISCPPPVTVERNSPAGTDVTLTVQVTDPDAEPVTVTWNVDGMDVQTDNVLGLPSGPTRVTLRRVYSLGTHSVTVTVSDGEAAPVSCSTTVTVTAATTSLSVAPASGTFGGTTALQATLTAGGVGVSNKSISFSLNGTSAGSAITDENGVAMLPGVSLGAINAGSYPAGVMASFAGDVEFTPSTGAAALTVLKATPTINVIGTTVTYDGKPHPATGTATGVKGESLGALMFTYTDAYGNTTADAPINAGSYIVNASFAGNDNYTPASNSTAVILINKATPTVTVTGGTFTYDGDPHPATGSATGVYGDDLGGLSFTYNGLSAAPVNAGSYAVIASFAGNNNYNPASNTATILITKATPATFNITGGTFTYDGDPHPATGSALGVKGEDLGAVTFTYNGMSDAPVNAGTYLVIATFGGNLNYNPASGGSASIVITKATPTVNATGGTFTYDGDPHAATGSATGVKGEDLGAVTFTYNGMSDAPVNAGSYLVIATFAGNANYTAASNNMAQIVINKATPTVTVTGGTFTYDGDPHPATGSVIGVKGESLGGLSFTYNGSTSAPLNAGSYAVTGSYAESANYTAATGSATITITRATPLLNWSNPADIVFGTPLGAAQLNATASFKGASLPGSFTYTPGAGSVLNAGAGQVLTVSFAPADSTNFTTATTSATLNVLKATPLFRDLSSPTIAFQTATTVLSGKISAGALVPTGSVMITLNGVTQAAPIGADGAFSSSFKTGALRVANPPYVITYSYGGDLNFLGASGKGILVVADVVAPVVNCNCRETSLWPPNHDLIDIGFTASAIDDHDGTTPFTVQVFSDEDDDETTGAGNHAPDATGMSAGPLRVRAERKGNSDGRVYLIVVTAKDQAGNTGSKTCTVVVPHSQSKADIAKVNAQAAAAVAHYNMTRTLPTGYVPVGDGAIIGPKQ